MTTATVPPAETGTRMSRREVLQALSGLMVGMFVAILASTVVANALPRIIADLNGSQTVYTWIVTSELLAMTATVPLWGKMADLYSKKLLIQLSLGLFVVGSLRRRIHPERRGAAAQPGHPGHRRGRHDRARHDRHGGHDPAA